MIDKQIYENYIQILRNELVPAMGCTEPIAIAYAAAKARSVLGEIPEHISVRCSGNIIKNVKGVIVPNSGGLKGMKAAAVLGVVGGDPGRKLEVLNSVKKQDIEKTKQLTEQKGYCTSELAENVDNLYIEISVYYKDKSAKVTVRGKHTNICKIEKDGCTVFSYDGKDEAEALKGDKSLLDIRHIYDFTNEVEMKDIYDIITLQINYNTMISDEGLRFPYGAQVGRTLLEEYGEQNVAVRARAKAAAGSDARMSGCPLPVVINSGSGNQGIAVSIPVIEYAREWDTANEKLYRALVLANLISIHQKRFIGDLSAYCGATSAGCGAACGIAYLKDARYQEIGDTITNSIATIGGMICDGAKASCAAKIAAAVETAITAYKMSIQKRVFQPGEGLVEDDIEKTIRNFGIVGREGMRETDVDILKLMCE